MEKAEERAEERARWKEERAEERARWEKERGRWEHLPDLAFDQPLPKYRGLQRVSLPFLPYARRYVGHRVGRHPPARNSISGFVCAFVGTGGWGLVCVCMYLYIYLYIYLYQYIYISLYIHGSYKMYTSIYLSIHPSIHLRTTTTIFLLPQ